MSLMHKGLLKVEVSVCTGVNLEINPKIEKTGETFEIANTDGSFFQHDRNMAQAMPLEERNRMAAAAKRSDLRMTLSSRRGPHSPVSVCILPTNLAKSKIPVLAIISP